MNLLSTSALTAMGETARGVSLVGNVPAKLARTVTQSRGNRDHWENTQENMFCMNALVDYARVYEKTEPAMTVTARLDHTALGTRAFDDFRDPPATFARPMQASDPGRSATVTLEKEGEGRLYYAVRMRYSPSTPRTEPELRHDAVRFYSDDLPAGSYHLSYTAQAIATGEFQVMPSHAEQMYDPDVFRKGLPAMLNVGEVATATR